MQIWTEHTSPDGRKYYFNSITKQSSWDKPDELKTSEEVIIKLKIILYMKLN